MRGTFLTCLFSALALLGQHTAFASPSVSWRGVSESGLEWASAEAVPSTASINFFTKAGANLIRVPFGWERIQPALLGNLDKTEFRRVSTIVNQVTAQKKYVLLDPHNYMRYNGQLVTPTQLANLWTRLARRFQNNQYVVFGLMNEPNSQSTESVLANNQAAINAIRRLGAKNIITVPGNAWTGAHSWFDSWYGTPNSQVMSKITDPLNNMVYEMHQYLDGDFSGTSSACQSATVGVEQLRAVTAWARGLKRKIFLGEFAGGDNALCYQALTNMVDYMKTNSDVWVGWAWWAAGSGWGDSYIYTVEPTASGTGTPQWNNFLKEAIAA
ncbi:hypothetical protein HKX48_007632 [Thoreauomyces humboldtii]|nr:hypothetical protein HKX48_007632 [Thoreauomyces humboldtii]